MHVDEEELTGWLAIWFPNVSTSRKTGQVKHPQEDPFRMRFVIGERKFYGNCVIFSPSKSCFKMQEDEYFGGFFPCIFPAIFFANTFFLYSDLQEKNLLRFSQSFLCKSSFLHGKVRFSAIFPHQWQKNHVKILPKNILTSELLFGCARVQNREILAAKKSSLTSFLESVWQSSCSNNDGEKSFFLSSLLPLFSLPIFDQPVTHQKYFFLGKGKGNFESKVKMSRFTIDFTPL